MKPKVFITRKIADEIVELIRLHCEVKMWDEEDTPVPKDILEKEIKDVDGLYCLLTETIDKELLDKANNLKVISNMAVGYNNIDVEAATEKGVAVTNTPGVLTETTADLTFALLMSTARRVVEAEKFLKNGDWQSWSPMLLTGQDIFGATIGIIGLGKIGEAVAKRAKGFDMEVIYYNRTPKSKQEKELGIQYVEFDELLKKSDYVCVLTPFTPETKDLISTDQFNLMKENAILINTSRGGIVNEEALYHALTNKQIWGAGLDVFEQEPVSLNHPLLQLSNVVTLPHIGSASIKTRMKMANLASENLIGILQQKSVEYVINPEYNDFK